MWIRFAAKPPFIVGRLQNRWHSVVDSRDQLVGTVIIMNVRIYQVFRGNSQVATSTQTTYADTGLTASTTYTYVVKAFDSSGNISASSTLAAATTTIATSCSQSSSFLARASTLNNSRKILYNTLICGLVADGIWSQLDALYILAAPDETAAQLNLIDSRYTLTKHGSPTFTVDQGYTGDASSAYFDTGFVPSTAGGNMTLNSATLGAYVLNNRTTFQVWDALGVTDGANMLGLNPMIGYAGIEVYINGSSADYGSNSSSRGSFIASRTGVSSGEIYENGAAMTPITQTSTALLGASIYLFATDRPPYALASSGDQVAAEFFGGGLNSTQAGELDTLINNFMAALPTPINVH